MNECEGYLTEEGLCILTNMPVGEYNGVVVEPPPPVRDELPNTGPDGLLWIAMTAGLLISAGLALARWAVDRRTVTHEDQS